MARLYANENFPSPVVLELRRHGHDVLTVRETGAANLRVPDPQVLDFAISEERAVLTQNRQDFIRLHRARGGNHHGIIVCTVDDNFERLASGIHDRVVAEATLTGKLIRIYRPS